ncbi:MAG: hypothetical protein CMH57_01930 [Myxococcales bacterium]|nr:hypothetical protein [Myxococcales bacterium]
MEVTGRNLGRSLTEALRARGSEVVALSPGDEALREWTAHQLQDHIVRMALGLSHEGLQKGDRVLLASGANLELFMIQVAVWALGAVTVHLDDGLSEAQMGEALGRVKARWMVLESRQTLGALELMNGEAVSQATLVMRQQGDAERQASRVLSVSGLLELGRKRRLYDLNELAQRMYQVPEEARAAIVYWPGEGLEAAALSHHDLMGAQAPLPVGWGVKVGDRALVTTPPGSRVGVIASLRLLAHRVALVFPEPDAPLHRLTRQARPHGVVGRSSDLGRLWEQLHSWRQSERSVRGAFMRGLGWLGRKVDEKDEEEGAPTLEWLLEQGELLGLAKDLGEKLRWVWCLEGELASPLRAQFEHAGAREFVS